MSRKRTASYCLELMFSMTLFIVQSCAPETESSARLAVTNSSPVLGNQFQSVIKLSRLQASGDPIICTGSFITSTKILTAAHCLGTNKSAFLNASWAIDDATTVEKQAIVIAAHPLFKIGGKAIQPNDLAILAIDNSEGIAPVPIKLFGNSIEIGSEVTLLGFGNNNEIVKNGAITGTGAGIKRVGRNKLYTSTPSGLLIVSSDAHSCDSNKDNSITATGDSGGPLLIDDQVAGITLGGGILPAKDSSTCPKAISYFANLQVEQNADFILRNLDQFDSDQEAFQ